MKHIRLITVVLAVLLLSVVLAQPTQAQIGTATPTPKATPELILTWEEVREEVYMDFCPDGWVHVDGVEWYPGTWGLVFSIDGWTVDILGNQILGLALVDPPREVHLSEVTYIVTNDGALWRRFSSWSKWHWEQIRC